MIILVLTIISPDKFQELKGFETFPDDIIVSCAGTIGETYVMPSNMRRGVINQALMRIMLYDKRMTDFYLLYFDFVLKSNAQNESKGTAIKNIPPFDILKQFAMPSQARQGTEHKEDRRRSRFGDGV